MLNYMMHILSVVEALNHGGLANDSKVKING